MKVTLLTGPFAGILATVAFGVYLRGTFLGRTKPNRATWWILTAVGFIIVSSYYASGARETIWLAVAFGICPLVVAVVSLKYGEGGWNRFDQICLGTAAISLVLWWYTDSPQLALAMNLVIDFVGLLPTIRKSYLSPETEDRLAWAIGLAAAVISLFAIEQWKFSIAVYPLYMVATNGIIVALLYARLLKRARAFGVSLSE